MDEAPMWLSIGAIGLGLVAFIVGAWRAHRKLEMRRQEHRNWCTRQEKHRRDQQHAALSRWLEDLQIPGLDTTEKCKDQAERLQMALDDPMMFLISQPRNEKESRK